MNAVTRTYAAQLYQAHHAHDTMSVTMVLMGSLCERVGAVEEIARPLSIVVKPADTVHQDRFGPGGVRTLQINLSAREAADVADVHPSMRHWSWRHSSASARAFIALARALRQSANDVELATHDALASIDAEGPAGGDLPQAIRLVTSRLDDERGRSSAHELAATAALHPVYLARLFRRHIGMTVSQYVRRLRVRELIAGMTRPGTSLSVAAHAAGFADHAHMSRSFRAETGVTPSEYRALLR